MTLFTLHVGCCFATAEPQADRSFRAAGIHLGRDLPRIGLEHDPATMTPFEARRRFVDLLSRAS